MQAVTRSVVVGVFLGLCLGLPSALRAAETENEATEQSLPSIQERLLAADSSEVPDFRKHVVPMLGRLGCNGRACHGSFKGQGDFRLSLFGYDFGMDHQSLTQGEDPRINTETPAESLILQKPTMKIPHEGGKRLQKDGWQYKLLERWINAGARGIQKDQAELVELVVTPSEIVFDRVGQTTAIQVSAVWSDGTTEDVTSLTRFRSNDDQIVLIDEDGMVTSHDTGDTHVVAFFDNGVVPVSVILPVSESNGEHYPETVAKTEVDRLVIDKLKKLGIVPSETCPDATFLRRVSLDMTGTLPQPNEVEAFLADTSPDKRARKIDELLERPTYAAWWTTQLCDITGNNEKALQNTSPNRKSATQGWYDWIRKRVSENEPYDKIVAGIVLATGREEGQDYLAYSTEMSSMARGEADFAERHTMPFYWARRNVRQPAEKALSFAYSFLGVRIECAQCHKHPFDQWTQDDYKQFTNFFNRVQFGYANDARKQQKEMIAELELDKLKGGILRRKLGQVLMEGETVPFQEVYVAGPGPKSKKNAKKKNKKAKKNNKRNQRRPPFARILGGEQIRISELDDPRSALMEWMREKDNPYFARAFVNRVWANYFNVGIVDPPDDLSLANPPSNEPLLNYLAQEFVNHDFDMKWLHREIANSDTYQRDWKPNATNRLDEHNFSRSIPRRLPAEVAYDAIVQATASNTTVEKLCSDPVERAIAIPSLGRFVRGNGSRYALTIFGKSVRESNCDCDRSAEPSLLQTIYLRNDNDTLAMIDRNRDGWLSEVVSTYRPTKKNQLAKQNRPVKKQKNQAKKKQPKKNNQSQQSEQNRKKKNAPAKAKKQAKNKKKPEKNAAQKVNQQINRMKVRLAQFEKNGKTEKAAEFKVKIAKAQQRLKKLISQRKKEQQKKNAKNKNQGKQIVQQPSIQIPASEIPQLVQQAYLRTLSRYPEPAELERSQKFIAESSDSITGLRGLLWALVNTKEFIVNH